MESATSLSLLDRLQQRPDDQSWLRLDRIYRPWICRWLGRDSSLGAEVDDLAQDILDFVWRELPRFEHRGPGSFRRWLRAIAANRLKGYYRRRQSRPVSLHAGALEGGLIDLADDRSELARLWDEEHNTHVIRSLLDLIAAEFGERDMRAFRRVVLDEARPALVADELGVSVNVVLLAKSRILKRLREVGKGLLD